MRARLCVMAMALVALALGGTGCAWPWPGVQRDDPPGPPPETLIETPAEVTGTGVERPFEGPPPQPATREGCVARWNDGDADLALASVPPGGMRSGEARVQIGSGEQADRCIVWLWAGSDDAPEAASYLIEIAPGRFTWGGGVSFLDGGPDATLDADGRLTLR